MTNPTDTPELCAECGEEIDFCPGESFMASIDGRVWHLGCAPSRKSAMPENVVQRLYAYSVPNSGSSDGQEFLDQVATALEALGYTGEGNE